MTLRSRLATAPSTALAVPVGKGYGSAIPADIQAAEARSQMTPASPFAPGTPIGPYDGFSRTPRSREYPPQYNVATRPRTHERVSFETLKGLIESYDVAQIVIRHRIASLRSLDWKLVAADESVGDIAADVAEGKRILKRPDGKTIFKSWLAKYLRDILSYDAGTLYKMRNRGGRVVGLQVVSGITVAPLLDYWGNSPDSPAPAYVQYVNGLPWNWLTREDLIYEPYDPQPDSIYGRAPLEDIILNANTDIRFQLYFLQRFTAGSLPAAFASAPDSWSPDQIEAFQEYWDGFMLGNQEAKHQIRWLPPGSKFTWSNEKDFSDEFSLFLMRKSCAAYAVVPSDLGFTETTNRSSGESQADVQHRVGDLPLAHHVQDILTAFLQDDAQLPLKFAFDLGEEQDDRLNQAQADKIYFDIGSVGSSELRELRYGWTDPVPIPRTIMTSRGGPVPIASLLAIAGEIDPATALPAIGAALPKDVFGGVEGVLPEPPVKVTPLAERLYGPSAMPPAPPPQPQLTDSGTVAKDGEGAASSGNVTAGITSETGIHGYDLVGRDDEDETPRAPRYITVDEARKAYRDAVADGRVSPAEAAAVEARMAAQRAEGDAEVAKEMAAFRRFAKARRKSGEWRDFAFEAVPAGEARRLNAEGFTATRKAASGYDLSPRSGMISLDLPEGLISPPPGGVAPDDMHVTVCYLGKDVSDRAFAAACERAEGAAASLDGPLSGVISGLGTFEPSGSSDGKTVAWAAVALPGAERLRAALEDLSASEHTDWTPHLTLRYQDAGDDLPEPVPPTPVTFTHLCVHRADGLLERFPLGGGPVAKAVPPSPKAPRPPAGRNEPPRPARELALLSGPGGP